MTPTHHANPKTGEPESAGRRAKRTRRTVRFSDPERKQVQVAAARRGITPSEYVRSAALGGSDGALQAETGELSPGLVEIIKLTHRSAYILSTLKRDEMIREGRAREMDEVVRAARNAQADVLHSESLRHNARGNF